jgi:hypothetical protein
LASILGAVALSFVFYSNYLVDLEATVIENAGSIGVIAVLYALGGFYLVKKDSKPSFRRLTTRKQ